MWIVITTLMMLGSAAPLPDERADEKADERADQKADDKADEAEVDHLELAALLVRDGHPDRAARELAAIDADALEHARIDPTSTAKDAAEAELSLRRYWTLTAVIALHDRAHLQAAQAFTRAIELGADDPAIPGFIAQCWVALAQWEAAVAAFERVPPASFEAEPRLLVVHANALWRAGHVADAYALLQASIATHPERAELRRLLLFLLAEAGLHHAAGEVGRAWLTRDDVTRADYLAAADALRRARAWPEAQAMLDEAAWRFPDDPELMALMGRTLLDRGQPLSAALLLERTSLVAPERALDAAELYRRAGLLDRALWTNARVPEGKARLRQRIGLLAELERFEELAVLGEHARRLGLEDDDSIVYALAFASFQVGDHASAERWLERIESPELFEKAALLRRSIVVCRAEPERCP